MDHPDIPEDYIVRYGTKEAGYYFAELFMQKRAEGKVAVLIDDFTTSFFFIECDKHGYPKRRYTDFLTYMAYPKLSAWEENSSPVMDTSTVLKKTIEVESPLISYNFRPTFYPTPYVFMWQGRILDKAEVPIESLDVSKLLRLAQEAVQKREGLIIDEVLKNKLIK